MTYKALVENTHSDLLSKRNVIGVGVGQKWTNKVNTKKESLLVFVSSKLNKSELSQSDLIPESINGHTVDVVGKSGYISKLGLTQKVRPLKPGYSCGHLWVTAGTIGGFFRDRDGQVVMLSNNHVLAASNRGVRGNVALQPGIYDDKNWQSNIVGSLKYFRPLVDQRGTSFDAVRWRSIVGYNVEDSAVAVVTNQDLIDYEYPVIGTPNGFIDEVPVETTVQKVGRTTGHTTGTVIATDAIVNVQYDRSTFLFKDQIVTTVMGQGGDSGSMLFDTNKNMVGLLFAGSNTITIFNKLVHPRASYGLQLINTKKIKETKSLTFKVDGLLTQTNYDENTLIAAITNAKSLSRDGKVVEISVNYKSEPI